MNLPLFRQRCLAQTGAWNHLSSLESFDKEVSGSHERQQGVLGGRGLKVKPTAEGKGRDSGESTQLSREGMGPDGKA